MKLFVNIRTKLGYDRLCRKVRKLDRTKTFNNLQTADTVGILFDSTQQSCYQVAKSLVASLQGGGKKVSALGMVLNNEMLNYYVPQDGINFFSLDKTTFWCYPDSPVVEQFVANEFDILLNISIVENLSVDYVMGLSKAKCKVSKQLCNNDFADFLLQFKDPLAVEPDKLVARMQEYLSMLSRG